MAMSSASAVISDCDGVPGQQSRCTLCKGRLRGRHTHPGQWKSELQQFLQYSEIPGSSCVCRTCDRTIRRGLHGKYKGEYIPCWSKTLQKKSNVAVYQVVAKPVVFADFDTICEAANVSVSEEEVSSSLHLCSEHY